MREGRLERLVLKRRVFIRTGSLIGAAGAAGALGLGLARGRIGRGIATESAAGIASGISSGAEPDLVLRRATVFDGTGAPGMELDVAVTGDRITEVGRVAATGSEEIDLAGMALAPGFIDIHSHADLSLLVNPNAESRVRQGVTLEIVGQDGNSVGPMSDAGFRGTRDRYRDAYGVDIDFRDLGGFLDRLDRTPATVNLATMIGHGTIRGLVVGGEDRPATGNEIQRMRALIGEALDQGAVGFSSGLEYTPGSFADVNELVELAKELRGTGYPTRLTCATRTMASSRQSRRPSTWAGWRGYRFRYRISRRRVSEIGGRRRPFFAPLRRLGPLASMCTSIDTPTSLTLRDFPISFLRGRGRAGARRLSVVCKIPPSFR